MNSSSRLNAPVSRVEAEPDWFWITDEQAQIAGVSPGLRHLPKFDRWICHRSHLPLLPAPATEPIRGDRLGQPAPAFDSVTLRPHQLDDVQFLRSRKSALHFGQQRTGKTATPVGAHELSDGPLVVCGPLATKRHWLRWFQHRWPGIEPVVLEGKTYDSNRVEGADVIFAHFDVMAAWHSVGLNRDIGTFVIDEIHLASNRKSGRTQGCVGVATRASRIVGMTGTPLWNQPAKFWAMLNLVAPAAFGTYWDYSRRFCNGGPGPYGWTTGDPAHTDELQKRLGAITIVRRLCDVYDVPPMIREIRSVALSDAQCKELDRLVVALRDGATTRETVVGNLGRYRRLVGEIKVPAVVDTVLAERVKYGRVVVWAWHRDVVRQIADALADADVWCRTVLSGVSEKRREAAYDAWAQTDDGVLVMNLGIGQAGIDLSVGHSAVVAELDWTPAVMGQALMRHFSLQRDHRVVFVVANHDVEQRLVRVLSEKERWSQAMGVPASDTPMDMLAQVFSGADPRPDPIADLVSAMADHVNQHGTTFL